MDYFYTNYLKWIIIYGVMLGGYVILNKKKHENPVIAGYVIGIVVGILISFIY